MLFLLSNRNFRKLFSFLNVFSARVLCVTCFQVPFTEKRLQNAHAGIKNVWGEMGQEFPSETFLPENRTNFSDIPLLPEIFLSNDPKNCVIFTFFLNVFSTRVLYRTWLGTTDLWKNLWWSSSQDNFFLLLIFSTAQKIPLYTKILKVRFEKLLPLVYTQAWVVKGFRKQVFI